MTRAESPGTLKSNLIIQGSDSCVYRGLFFSEDGLAKEGI